VGGSGLALAADIRPAQEGYHQGLADIRPALVVALLGRGRVAGRPVAYRPAVGLAGFASVLGLSQNRLFCRRHRMGFRGRVVGFDSFVGLLYMFNKFINHLIIAVLTYEG